MSSCQTSKGKFMDKEQFYIAIKEIRDIVKDPECLKCRCPNTFCEWYGKCKECVAQHRGILASTCQLACSRY